MTIGPRLYKYLCGHFFKQMWYTFVIATILCKVVSHKTILCYCKNVINYNLIDVKRT